MEQRFEDISVNFVNAQADLEQREEDLKIGTTNTLSIIFFFKNKNLSKLNIPGSISCSIELFQL